MTPGSIAVDAIVASKSNPRKHFDKVAHAELTDSVGKHGVLQPILVRPNGAPDRYELVAGERRLRAAKAAGLVEIPALVRELSDTEVLEIQIVENLQRSDLHPIEEAEGYEALLKCKHPDGNKYTVDDIAAKVGKSRSYVYARLKYADLGKEAREAFFDGKLNESTALYVARIPVPALQKKAVGEISRGYGGAPISAREAADHIRRNYMLQLERAPFPTGDAELLKGTPSCSACAKRTGNQPELFGDVKSADVCTDPECFERKREAQVVHLTKVAKEKGQDVIAGAAAKKLIQYSGCNPKGYIRLDHKEYVGNGKQSTVKALLGKDLPAIRKEHMQAVDKTGKKKPPKAPSNTANGQSAKSKRAPPRRPLASFMKPVQPDAVLAAVIGETAAPRIEITGRLWKYIKHNGCQDKTNKRLINADEKLRALFEGKDSVSMFELTKLMARHLQPAKKEK